MPYINPERNPADLDPVLRVAWYQAEALYKQRHPAAPQPFLTQCYRSPETQNKLYAQGRTTPGKIVTQAKGGQSPHNFRPSMAFDVAFMDGAKLSYAPQLFADFAACVQAVAADTVEWGGSWKGFKDTPHFQRRGWRQLLK